MEAHKERAEQVEREEAKRNVTGRSSDDADIPKVVLAGDKVYEDVIRKAVAVCGDGGGGGGEDKVYEDVIRKDVADGGGGGGDTHGKVMKSPEDVLVFSRSVDKIDSSLQ